MSKKILIVDYENESLNSLSKFFQEEGFEVVTASDGILGFEKFKAENPNLVITEAMLPKLDGFNLCHKIQDLSSHKIPVIIITGVYRENWYKTEALHVYGASAFFEKPIEKNELLFSIYQILDTNQKMKKSEDYDQELDEVGQELKENFSKEEKIEKKAPASPDVDQLLTSTLADLGLTPVKKKTPPEIKPKLKPEPKPEAKPEFRQKEPIKKEEIKEEITTRPPLPEKKEEKQPISVMTPFEAYATKKKRAFSPVLIGSIAAVLIAIGAGSFVLFKPKKTPLPEEQMISSSSPLPTLQLSEDQTSKQPLVGESPSEAASQSTENPPASSEKIPAPEKEVLPPPLLPAETPPLNIQDARKSVPETPARKEPEPSQVTKEVAPPPSPAKETEQISNPAQPPTTVNAPEPPKTKEGDLVPLEQVNTPPVLLKTVSPKYPPLALQMKIEGTIQVNALISETGDVINTRVIKRSSNVYGLDKASEEAVRKWKFKPAQKDGVNVKVWKQVSVVFKLE